MLIPKQTIFFPFMIFCFSLMETYFGCPHAPSEHEICGRRKESVLTRGVVFDPIEELGAGSLHQFPRRGSGPAGPDLVRGGIAVWTWG